MRPPDVGQDKKKGGKKGGNRWAIIIAVLAVCYSFYKVPQLHTLLQLTIS